MSYILDALRRAESERQRGQVPGLGALPPPQASVAGPAGSRAVWWAALGLLMLGLAAALLWWLQRPTPSPMAAGVEAALTAPPVTVTKPAAKSAPESPPIAAAATAVPLPASPAPASLPMVVSAPPVPAPSPVPVEPALQAQPAADTRIVKLAELTPQQLREWPALGVGGSVWSDSAASRFVILNGQVLREGQAVGPGLTLERIQPRAVLLRWRGLLVELPL